MDTEATKNTSRKFSPQSLMLAKKAKKELMLTGTTTVLCPVCKESPTLTMTSRDERTIISCKCGFVFTAEINL